jgi:hypothetical protein
MTIPLFFGPYGAHALNYADNFNELGANAAWFHGFDGKAFDICQKHSIAACVEFKTFRADFNQHPELIPIGVDGKPIRYGELVQGVCLSQVDYLEETEANLLNGIQTYAPAGIWFDYLTYSGWFESPTPDLQESCFCAACVADFCSTTGIDAQDPHVIVEKHQHAWTNHKTDRIAGFAKQYVKLIHSYRPSTTIGAYMCPWTPQEFNRALTRIFAQDYVKLAPFIDVFTPLIYVEKSGRTASWGREFLEQAYTFIPRENKISLILDILDYPDSLIETAQSTHPSWGLQMYGGDQVFTDPAKAETYKNAVEEIKTRISTTD